jgi:hypothetical protein
MTLTEEQFKEKYGEVEVMFSSYFKYTFVFRGDFYGKEFQVNVGGSSEDIYRFDVRANDPIKIKYLDINYAQVVENENIIDNCLNYF